MTNWSRNFFAAGAVALLSAGTASAVVPAALDRDYGFGEADPGAVAGGPVSATITGFPGVFTFDNAGTPGVGNLQDMQAFGNPVYASAALRPAAAGTAIGIAFDGVNDYLVSSNLNNPANSQASPLYDDWEGVVEPSPLPAGPNNYNSISNRFFQFWAKPNAASLGKTQSVVMDSNQHGVRIVDGKWTMRYAGVDRASRADVSQTTVTSDWQHVLLARPEGAAGGARLFVNGVAVATASGGYNGAAHEQLVVGSTTGRDENNSFNGGNGEFYHGVLDDLTMWVIGSAPPLNYVNQDGVPTTLPAVNYGQFTPATDNAYIRDVVLGVQGRELLDFDGDGVLEFSAGANNNDGDDVDAFVAGWFSRQLIGGIQVGDLNSLANGDVNFDGITNLADWAAIRSLNPAFGAALGTALGLSAVPEPGSAWLACLAVAACLRRRY